MNVVKQLWNNNPYFYSLFVGFLLVGAVMLALIDQGADILFVNQYRSDFGDAFFRFATMLGEAYIYIPALIILLFVKYRHAAAVPLLGITVILASGISKQFFAHERPFLFFKNAGLLDQIDPVTGVAMHGGLTSFPSGHTMSAFAIFAFLAFSLPEKKGLGALLFLIALLVGFSRIYLIQHFLKDVYLGAIMGVTIAVIWYWLAPKILKSPRLEQSLLKKQA